MTALFAVVMGTMASACSALDSRDGTAAESAITPRGVTVPTETGGVTVPAGTGATTGSATGTTGPGEKPNQRGNTPPGTSRDGAGPLGGAIVDPAGAATGKR